MLLIQHNITWVYITHSSGTCRNRPRRSFFCIVWILLLMLNAGCTKFIEVGPPKTETIVGATVYTNDVGATGALLGIYGRMINSKGFAGGATRSVTFLAGLSADELTNYSGLGVPKQFYENAIYTNNEAIEGALWSEVYQYIYAANDVWTGVQNSEGKVTLPARKQLQGEARFIRAFCHFYLVNLYGGVPWVTTTNYQVNMGAARTPEDMVYQHIIADLKVAQGLLEDVYVTGQRVRPNKAAVTALLARVYLYRKDWANAAAQASLVISNPAYSLNDTLNQVFLQNSTETIWQLMPNTPGINTWEGNNFILTAAPTTEEANAATLSPRLLQAFESGDQRRSNWIDSVVVDTAVYYFPHKYKIKTGNDRTEYSMVLRLAEQYLVRAEARAHLGNYAGARADLNVVRKRAGLPYTTANTQTALLAAIEQERQVELFTEWGHRWLDLKRTYRANAVLGPLKAPGWKSTAVLYPIPQNEMAKNVNLKPQNPGYE